MAKNQTRTSKNHRTKSRDDVAAYVQRIQSAGVEGSTDESFVSEAGTLPVRASGMSVGLGDRQQIDPHTGEPKEEKKKERNWQLLATWAGIILIIAGGVGTSIYRFAILETKVENTSGKIVAIDGTLQNLAQKTDNLRERLIVLEERGKSKQPDYAGEIDLLKRQLDEVNKQKLDEKAVLKLIESVDNRLKALESKILPMK
ncbi:MAG: hypothetical protein NTW55_04370 [Planctomycetota bacterium]|nr:hypothetical protein [Planctomycetota bacterium]